MGILNSYERISDTTLTLEGRRQLADGSLRFKYASFSDAGCVYERPLSGSYDAGVGVGFEAASLPHDTIVPEGDEHGGIQPVIGTSYVHAGNRSFATGSVIDGSSELLDLPGTNLARLSMLGDQSLGFADDDFGVSPESRVYGTVDRGDVVSASDIPVLFEDSDFSRVENFSFMPPVDRTGNPIGEYVQRDVAQRSNLGKKAQTGVFNLDPRPRVINSILQMFEVTDGRVRKLAMTVKSENPLVVLAGWVIRDESGTERFVRIWRLEFE